MAVDMFLIIKDLPGESSDAQFGSKGAIDVAAWSWGVSQSATTHTGPGGGSGKASVSDISITKHIDKSTPNLIKFCCMGKHFANAEIIVRKAGGEKPLPYLTITLEDVIISSVNTGGVASDDRIQEQISLNFKKFKVQYTPQTEKGAGGGPVTGGFDIAANTPYG